MENKIPEFIINEEVKNQILTGLFLEKERLAHLYEENEKRITLLVSLPKYHVKDSAEKPVSITEESTIMVDKEPENNNDQKS